MQPGKEEDGRDGRGEDAVLRKRATAFQVDQR